MNWGYRFDERALKELKKLGRQAQQEILAYLDKRVANNAEPRRFGQSTQSRFSRTVAHRVGDYRILCQIKDRELLVLVVAVGHRKNVYE